MAETSSSIRGTGRTWRWIVPAAYMAGIWWLSSDRLPVDLPGQSDKLVHAGAYGILAALWIWALTGERAPRWRWALGVILASGWGFLDEWHQRFVPGRSAELADVAADCIGGVLAGGALLALRGLTGALRGTGQGTRS